VPRPKLRTPELRERVLEAALATLTERGVAGLTARQVAKDADTSVPAVYELFGDKAGIVREIFFTGFRRLGADLDAVAETTDARADLVASITAFRTFARPRDVRTRVR
jgi:AcrR family transcriptional regulator